LVSVEDKAPFPNQAYQAGFPDSQGIGFPLIVRSVRYFTIQREESQTVTICHRFQFQLVSITTQLVTDIRCVNISHKTNSAFISPRSI